MTINAASTKPSPDSTSGLKPLTYKWIKGRFHGARVFRCIDCEYDVLENESTIQRHCEDTGHGVVRPSSTLDAPLNVMITLGYLCWNTREASVDGARELIKERGRLIRAGSRAEVFILDNGSEDGTYDSVLTHTQDDAPDLSVHLPYNCGSSISRNYMIDLALKNGSDYLLLMDGDIEVVPLSVFEMVKYLESKSDVGCIGAYSSGFTAERSLADTIMPVIQDSRIRSHIRCAWTQYGLFRVEMFRQGIRFDEAGPFGKPGWGMEDDDLYFQMRAKGWECQCFNGMTYLHRALHSSWKSLDNPRATFEARKSYFLSKWTGLRLDPAILALEAGQQFPGD